MRLKNFIDHMNAVHSSAKEYYQDMNYDIVPGLNGTNHARWMNVGYWKHAAYYNQACEKLAMLLSRAGKFNESDSVLDVGCGSGEQDFFWSRKYPGISITAMDLLEKHIEEAIVRQKNEEGTSIRFMAGTASRLPFDNESFHKVSALDCAYHFDTREDFFREAHRVLKRGGVLTATDMLPEKQTKKKFFWQKKWREGLFIPEENMYDINCYVKKLKAAGFSQIKVKHIGHEVFSGLAWYFLSRFLMPHKPIEQIKIRVGRVSFFSSFYPKIWGILFGTPDYVLVTAVKKGKEEGTV